MAEGFAPHAGNDRQLISDVAEASLLGALLTKPALLASLPTSFDPSHYGCLDHEEIHRALVEVGRPGVPAAVAVTQALAINDRDRRSRITNLLTSVVSYSPGSIAQYAEVVTDLYRRRQLVALSERMREGAFANHPDGSADGVVAQALSGLEDLLGGRGRMNASMSLNEAMDAALHKADEAAQRDGPAGLSTGFASIDEQIGGLEDGTLTVLAGRPGMGKSALGHQWALNVARQGIGVLEVSLEMSGAELGRRALSAISGVPVWAMKRGKHAPYVDRLLEARREMNDLPLTIEDGGGLTAAMIALKARAAHRKHGLGLIMIDHLHIVRPDDADARHGGTWAVGRISGAMKRLAKEFNCPVLLLAQLNRGVEGRDDKRPGLQDLRQSGDIEQDADAVGFVYRAEYYMSKEPEQLPSETREVFSNRLSKWVDAKRQAAGKAELIFAKVRDGAPGSVGLAFHGETTSFAEIEHGE
jgi:replicative DNA helicase